MRSVVEVVVHGSPNKRVRVKAVVDTGFTQHLTLPAHAIAALDLQFAFEEQLTMANDESVKIDVYTVVFPSNQINIQASSSRFCSNLDYSSAYVPLNASRKR